MSNFIWGLLLGWILSSATVVFILAVMYVGAKKEEEMEFSESNTSKATSKEG